MPASDAAVPGGHFPAELIANPEQHLAYQLSKVGAPRAYAKDKMPGLEGNMLAEETAGKAAPGGTKRGSTAATLEENVQAIKAWERATLLARSRAEQVGDWVASTAASGPVLLFHLVWFSAWIIVNVGMLPDLKPFDPFPFPFLTMTVSLEAIFLALFVLASQNRLARQSDKRSHLDLQVDLLAEREMTAVLQLLQDIARHLEVKTSVTLEQLRDLAKKTDLQTLTDRVEEFSDDRPAADASPQGSRDGDRSIPDE
jgi:uncharacterized membrane protein